MRHKATQEAVKSNPIVILPNRPIPLSLFQPRCCIQKYSISDVEIGMGIWCDVSHNTINYFKITDTT